MAKEELGSSGSLEHSKMILVQVYVVLFMPVKISFYSDEENPIWDKIDIGVDIVFTIDIVLTFFTPYIENDKIVVSLKSIGCNYLKFWFWMDVVSVFPFEILIDQGNVFVLSKMSRLPRLYKLSKITKMFRTLKAT